MSELVTWCNVYRSNITGVCLLSTIHWMFYSLKIQKKIKMRKSLSVALRIHADWLYQQGDASVENNKKILTFFLPALTKKSIEIIWRNLFSNLRLRIYSSMIIRKNTFMWMFKLCSRCGIICSAHIKVIELYCVFL